MSIKVKINKEGLKEFLNFISVRLPEEDQKTLAKILDKTFEFDGFPWGDLIEAADEKFFTIAIHAGEDKIEELLKSIPSPS